MDRGAWGTTVLGDKELDTAEHTCMGLILLPFCKNLLSPSFLNLCGLVTAYPVQHPLFNILHAVLSGASCMARQLRLLDGYDEVY